MEAGDHGVKVWFHILGQLTTTDRGGCLHAAPEGAQKRLARGRKTLPTVCGLQRTRPVGREMVNEKGEPIGQTTMLWPPRLSTLPEGMSRCQSCFVGTGRPRPAPEWSRGSVAT